MKRIIPLTIATFGLLMAARPLCAGTFTVLNTDDAGAGSLRATIILANANPGHDDIDFQAGVSGTIHLASALPVIAESTTLTGPGAGVITIDGNDAFQILHFVSPGRDQSYKVSGLTLTRGKANHGGAVATVGGESLELSDSVLSNNTATDFGGAISNAADLILTNVTFTGNKAIASSTGLGFGGAISNAGRFDLIRSTISGNLATDLGGGIHNQNPDQNRIINSTISGNFSGGDGGGIYNESGTAMDLLNVTVAENVSDLDGSGDADGGGIHNDGALSAANSIIAENHRGIDGPASDCTGALTSSGHNLIGDSTGCTITGAQTGDIKDQPSGIDPTLADNGGSTRTHALLEGSPAIDAGSPEAPGGGAAACASDSQNGATRPQGAACDIGAFELPFIDDAGGEDAEETDGGGDTIGSGTTGGGSDAATPPDSDAEPASGGCSLIRG